MPNYRCRVLRPDGSEDVMEIGAEGQREAAEILRGEGLFVLDVGGAVAETGKGEREQSGINPLERLLSPSKKSVILTIRQLAVLLESGIGIVQALSTLERQTQSWKLRRMLTQIRDDVEAGDSFSDALSIHKRVFKKYVVSVVRAAESSGELDIAVTGIADKLEEESEFKRQIVTAMIYPAILLCLALVVVLFLGLFVIPKFAPILGGRGTSMPWATGFVLGASDWITVNWLWVFKVVGCSVIVFSLLKRTDQGKLTLDTVLLRVPIVGKVIQCGSVVSFSTNLAMLYASGIPISDALQTVRDTLVNSAAARLVDRMVDSILSGGTMVEPLRGKEHIFPPMVAEMLATGEETGEMEKALLLLSRIFRTLLNNYVKRMSIAIEPLTILMLGGIVGFVFYALITGVLAVYGL